METLTILFGSQTKVKLLRFFLLNGESAFLPKELAYRTKCAPTSIRRELGVLAKAGVIKHRQVLKSIESREGEKIIFRKMRGTGYFLDSEFPYLEALKGLLTVASIQADDTIVKRLSGVGKIKLIIACGVFIQQFDARVDLLIVGDELNVPKIESALKIIESEIGKELSYSVFETADFEYRLGIHDRLIRDIIDYPHVTLVDKLGIDPK